MTTELDSRHPIETLAEEFTDLYRRGMRPSIEDYAQRHPDLADEIRELFPALQMMENATVMEAGSDASTDLRTPRGSLAKRAAWDHTFGIDEFEIPEKIERFFVSRVVGAGAFGIVLEALDPELNRTVALKIPRPEHLMIREVRSRFAREAEAVALLDHPNIVPIYEFNVTGSFCYIASAFIDGVSLAQWLADRKDPVPPKDAAILIQALANAAHHAHSRGVLHRDIKPGNVMLQRPGSDVGSQDEDQRVLGFRPMITDFGFARFLDDDATQTRSRGIVGTAAYMAPEQAEGRNREISTAADVYAFGAMLYELLAGQPPFHRESNLATMQAVRFDEPVPPSQRNRSVPQDLEAICLKCLQKEPRCRYASGAALAEDLRRFLNAQSVTARAANRGERVARWCRKNPMLSTLTASVLLLVVLLIVGSSTAAVMLASANKTSLQRLEDAIDAEREATQSKRAAIAALYEAYKSESRALRTSGRVGQSLNSLKAVHNAADRLRQLTLGDDERLALRNAAITSLALDDLSLAESWPQGELSQASRSVDFDGQYYAGWQGGRVISIRRMSDNSEVARLEASEQIRGHAVTGFSPHRRWIAARFQAGDGFRLNVWQIDEAKLVLTAPLLSYPIQPFDLSPHGSRLAFVRPDGSIELRSGNDFATSRTLPGEIPGRAVRFDPSGTRLAVVRATRADVLDAATGAVLQSFSEKFQKLDFSALDWSSDGRFLAVVCSDRVVRIWDTESNNILSRLRGHGGEVTHVSFHPAGRLIATSSYDGKTKLWTVCDGHEVLECQTQCTHFSRDGRWLCGRAERWRFFDADKFRRPLDSRWQMIHASGHVALSQPRYGLWRIEATGERHRAASADFHGYALFNRTGTHLIATRQENDEDWIIFQLAVASQRDGSRVTMKFGPAEEIARISAPYWQWAVGDSMLAMVDDRGNIQLVNIETGEVRDAESRHRNTRWMDSSAEDRLLATGTWHGKNVKLWEASTGKLFADHPSRSARVRFSPKSQILVTGERQRFSFRPVDPAKADLARFIEKESATPPSPLAYSPDGTILALAEKFRTVRLFDVASLDPLATLTIDASDEIDRVQFSPDGSQVLVAARLRSYLWNLDDVHARLSRMGLDWRQTKLHPARSAAKEVRLEIDWPAVSHTTQATDDQSPLPAE